MTRRKSRAPYHVRLALSRGGNAHAHGLCAGFPGPCGEHAEPGAVRCATCERRARSGYPCEGCGVARVPSGVLYCAACAPVTP